MLDGVHPDLLVLRHSLFAAAAAWAKVPWCGSRRLLAALGEKPEQQQRKSDDASLEPFAASRLLQLRPGSSA